MYKHKDPILYGDNPYGYFGLEGFEVDVTHKRGGKDERCWGYTKNVPMKVLHEYPAYLLVEVLPHYSALPDRVGISKPYKTTLHKHDILTEEILINGNVLKPQKAV